MDTGAALLKAVLADPDDDTARLVYADYLDETGDPVSAGHAKLIRRQIGSGTASSIMTDKRKVAWRGKGGPGIVPGTASLLKPLLPPPPPYRFSHSLTEVTFGRGFIWSVLCPSSWWLRWGDWLLARHPVLAVDLTTTPRVWNSGRVGLEGDESGIDFTAAEVVERLDRLRHTNEEEVLKRGGWARRSYIDQDAVLALRWPTVWFAWVFQQRERYYENL